MLWTTVLRVFKPSPWNGVRFLSYNRACGLFPSTRNLDMHYPARMTIQEIEGITLEEPHTETSASGKGEVWSHRLIYAKSQIPALVDAIQEYHANCGRYARYSPSLFLSICTLPIVYFKPVLMAVPVFNGPQYEAFNLFSGFYEANPLATLPTFVSSPSVKGGLYEGIELENSYKRTVNIGNVTARNLNTLTAWFTEYVSQVGQEALQSMILMDLTKSGNSDATDGENSSGGEVTVQIFASGQEEYEEYAREWSDGLIHQINMIELGLRDGES